VYWRLDNYVIYYCLIAQTLKYVFIISCYLVNVNIQLIKYRNAFLLATVICTRRNNASRALGWPEEPAAARWEGSDLPMRGSPVAKQPLQLSARKGRSATELIPALQTSQAALAVMGSLSEFKPWLCLVALKQR